ncbi:MAG: DUF433 domain-containing protein [Chthoniobacterales bacterium]
MDATSQDPEVLGGELVFAGTRVPVRSLFDHLEGGDSIEEFLEGFPSVRREQVMAALEDMEDLAVVQGRRSESTIAHEEIVAMLKEAEADVAAGRLLSSEEVRRSLNLDGSGAF